ncbi:RHS repeat-associated core domain-containing protein [Dyella marensis]|nr:MULTISPECIES: RHS repeat-associated core domain-containing protein [Dyella]
MLGVSWLGLGAVSAVDAAGASTTRVQSAPASISTARAPAQALSLSPQPLLAAQTASSGSSTFYGPPFLIGYKDPHYTVDEAAAAWWEWFQNYWGIRPPHCYFTYSSTSDGATTNIFGLMYQDGDQCKGGPEYIPGTAYTYNPGKNIGNGSGGCDGGEGSDDPGAGPTCPESQGSPQVLDPINASTGNKYAQENDYAATRWLTLRRFYNSAAPVIYTNIGSHWRHSFDRTLQLSNPNTTPTTGPLPAITAILFRPDGRQETFNKVNGQWVGDLDVADALSEIDDAQGNATGYTVFIGALRRTETYDTSGLLRTVTDPSGAGITLAYSTASTPSTVAPTTGLLLTVTDPRGRQLNFSYDSSGRVHQVALPDGGALTYTYDSGGDLVSVQYPDGKSKQYIYNESSLTGGANLRSALTGVIDEAGVRYETTTYNTAGGATSESLAGNVESSQLTYNADGTTVVQYPLGLSVKLNFTRVNDVIKVAGSDRPCGAACNQPWTSRTYDANGYPASYTDFSNNVTATTYNAAGLLTQTVELQGQSGQRTTATTWDTARRNPLQQTLADANGTVVGKVAWVYNARGQMLARCEIDPAVASSYACSTSGTAPAGVRRWTFSYCNVVDSAQCPIVGLLLSATGPRTDLAQTTTYSYYLTSSAVNCGTPGAACYQAGDLHTITDALGHVTTIVSYDGAGRVTRTTDANGINADTTYTARGWVATRTIGGATTAFTYTPYGTVASITDPDNVTGSYTYDAAHRLTRITDALGNYVQYTLDAAGNKTAEQVYDSSDMLRKSLSRTYNALGQLTGLTDGLNHTVFNASFTDSYDANGNLVHSTDALGIQRKQGYDALNRLVSTIDNYNGFDAATQNTQSVLVYGPRDELQGVSDPDGLNTTYDYDGLGNATGVHSPDTGVSTYIYDVAGNRIKKTDANGNVSASSYDALNRRTATTYIDSGLNVSYTYDEANSITGCSSSYPIGRPTRVIESAVTTVFCYDARGNVIQKRQMQSAQTDVTQYSYTLGDRLSSVIAPSATATQYTRDTAGRVNSVTVTPTGKLAITAVSGITYLPFGPVVSYTLGNGQTITRSYDADYALTDVVSSVLNLHFARNAMGNITALGSTAGASPAIETYAYDPMYRLTAVNAPSGSAIEAYTYNKSGDRLSKVAGGLATGTYDYQTGTHWLIGIGNGARTYDANGNTTGSAAAGNTYGYGYNRRNRLTVVQLNNQTVGQYTYNAAGQRVAKSATLPQATNERFAYDESNQLIGEYGTTNRDYIWLGELVVAVVDFTGTASTVNYVHADGLNTPRVITDANGSVIWQWNYQANPFGERQPTSSSGYVFNLRFPGQYSDAESGLYQNANRTYDSATGRYIESDPAGLNGGISLFGYAYDSPLEFLDPTGLWPQGGAARVPSAHRPSPGPGGDYGNGAPRGPSQPIGFARPKPEDDRKTPGAWPSAPQDPERDYARCVAGYCSTDPMACHKGQPTRTPIQFQGSGPEAYPGLSVFQDRYPGCTCTQIAPNEAWSNLSQSQNANNWDAAELATKVQEMRNEAREIK